MERKLLLQELHPALVHMPLALLPTAAVADLVVVRTGDRAWEKVGRRLWVVGAASAVFAGVSGLAASKEVRMNAPRARELTFVHGMGNALITAGALGLMAWRQARPPTVLTTVLGLTACASALVTAALSGRMVYEQGIGITPMPQNAPQGSVKEPPLLSREAPVALLKDAGRGAAWLMSWARTPR
ncbi:DUF2231 domain-containing protein [Corallococcus sp. EGB]|uniref:DUF2231 domain-containing protein n=1 Tax=Corallococcus sp. EGB TaxID=1521117 RepID=UPI001CC09085|nr:DUF2231 domain-containing protein [Corallococcus sp. EGB]